jgi:hypothetical protein
MDFGPTHQRKSPPLKIEFAGTIQKNTFLKSNTLLRNSGRCDSKPSEALAAQALAQRVKPAGMIPKLNRIVEQRGMISKGVNFLVDKASGLLL